MPPITSIQFSQNRLSILDKRKIEYSFAQADIPSSVASNLDPKVSPEQALETYLNNIWLPQITDGSYQIAIHVFSCNPLHLTTYTANIGEKIPDEWWLEKI